MSFLNKKRCYQQKTWKMPKSIEVEKTYSCDYGAAGQKRNKKRKRTPEDIERQNEWLAEKKLRRTINLNFKEDDWHLVLTYDKDKRPKSGTEARKHIDDFIKAVRKEYKKAGQPFKYVGAFGIGERGAPHFHMVVNNWVASDITASKVLRKAWKWGRIKLMCMDDTGEYKDLANYIIKQSKDTFREDDAVFKARYTCSKNLQKIEPEVEELGKYWSKNTRKIEVPEELKEQGWYLDKTSIVEGKNPVTGRCYQYYTLRLDESVYKMWKKQKKRQNTE